MYNRYIYIVTCYTVLTRPKLLRLPHYIRNSFIEITKTIFVLLLYCYIELRDLKNDFGL